jgi:hypothetical protein
LSAFFSIPEPELWADHPWGVAAQNSHGVILAAVVGNGVVCVEGRALSD